MIPLSESVPNNTIQLYKFNGGVATLLSELIETDSLVKLNVELNIFIQNLDDIEELTTKIDTIKNDVNDKDEFLITFGPRAIW